MDEPGAQSIASLAGGLLRRAVEAVPAMRYAVAVGGIGAVISLVLIGLKLDAATAIVGGVVVFAFMVILFVFSRLAASKSSFQRLTTVMAWSFSFVILASTLLIASCFFFDKPKTIPCLLKNKCSLDERKEPEPHAQTEVERHTTGPTTVPPHEEKQSGGDIASPHVSGTTGDVTIKYGDVTTSAPAPADAR